MSNTVTPEEKIAAIKDAADLSGRIAEETWYSVNLTMTMAECTSDERATVRKIMERAKAFRSHQKG